MINLRGAITVLRFELTRSLTLPRIALWLVLVLFPPSIVKLMFMGNYQIGHPVLHFGLPLLVLLPQVMCQLGLLLWASPIVYSELEAKSWIFVTTRPGGRMAVLLGKYLTAIAWTSTACWFALILVVQVAMHSVNVPALRLWLVYSVLIGLASAGYGALFVLIGTIFHRRAMVVTVAYVMLSEFVITMFPAVIRQFTLAYHFRCLAASWMNWSIQPGEVPPIFGTQPVWQHLLTIIGLTAALLIAAGVVIHQRQYITSEEV